MCFCFIPSCPCFISTAPNQGNTSVILGAAVGGGAMLLIVVVVLLIRKRSAQQVVSLSLSLSPTLSLSSLSSDPQSLTLNTHFVPSPSTPFLPSPSSFLFFIANDPKGHLLLHSSLLLLNPPLPFSFQFSCFQAAPCICVCFPPVGRKELPLNALCGSSKAAF